MVKPKGDTQYRSYKGSCRKCKAPEMVICKDDCTYVDPWKDYYLGPKESDRLRAKAIQAKDMAVGLHPVLRAV